MHKFYCFIFITLFSLCYSQELLLNKSFTLGEGNPEITFKDIDQLIQEENDCYKVIVWKLKPNFSDLTETEKIDSFTQVGKIISVDFKATVDEVAANSY